MSPYLKIQLLQVPGPLNVVILHFTPPLLNPPPCILPPSHLYQTPASSPPRLTVPLPLELDGAGSVRGAFRPEGGGHVCLSAVGVQKGRFFSEEGGGFEGRAGEGKGQGEGVEFYCFCPCHRR